jgi:hypothetical protein
MTSRRFSKRLLLIAATSAALVLMTVRPVFAKDPLPDAPVPAAVQPVAAAFISSSPQMGDHHKFWDNENRALFAATFIMGGADFAVTRANLQNGGQELNPMVRMFGRSTAGLAVNFASEGVGSVALSYLFHKTGHHKLERAVSFVNIGGSAGAVGYGLAHR